MGKFKDLTGMKFNKLRVIERAGYDNHKKILWRCVCDCGNITITHGQGYPQEGFFRKRQQQSAQVPAPLK